MDGTLTQDEINALLNGMDLSDSSNNASKDNEEKLEKFVMSIK